MFGASAWCAGCDGDGPPDELVDAQVEDAGAASDSGVSPGTPDDTYFALAITDDSTAHTGDRLLFLDFGDRLSNAFDAAESGGRVVRAPFVGVAPVIDGDATDWADLPATTVDGRPQNNYPLGRHYDAVPIPITVAAAYDDTHVYLRVAWEDPGHVRSDRRAEWTFRDGRWVVAPVAAVAAGSPASYAVNASGPWSGFEDQDRVLLAFPVRDPRQLFADAGLGCAGLCHAGLARTGDPADQPIGAAAVMQAGAPDALFDVWQWQAARTAPSGSADDLVFREALAGESGLAADEGESPYLDNREGDVPAFMHRDGFSVGRSLALTDAVPLAGTPTDGATIPGDLWRSASGSRADVRAAARFDEGTFQWVVELSRRLDTGHPDDRSLTTGVRARPPVDVRREPGDALAGGRLFGSLCSRCHGTTGQGVFDEGRWMFPRVQRASSSLIFQALQQVPAMAGLPADEQQVEDIAAFLLNVDSP